MSAPSPRNVARLAPCILFVTVCTLVHAQNLVDLDDPIYDLLARAEDRGLISPLPLLRPYPLQLVLSCLDDIQHRGNRDECRQATKLLESLHAAGRAVLPHLTLPAPIHATVEHESAWLEDHAGSTSLRLQSTGALGSLFSYSGRFSAGLVERPTAATVPRWTDWGDDGEAGGADVDIGGQTYDVNVEWKGITAVGTENVFFQAGLTRSVFGPFWDSSAVLGAQAPAAGHFSLTYRNDWLTYTSVLLELQALYAARTDGTVYSLKGALDPGEAFPAKYVALHTAVVSPAKWLDLGLIQSVVFGSRFSPLYLLPFQIVQYTQIQVGDYDNALMGLVGRARLPGGVSLSALMYVDDWNFDEMVRGSLDSGQNKCAFQAGASWSPWFPILANVRLGYTLVTPYMYTHSSFAPINYLNYEHAGQQLGSILPPDSDELRLTVDLRPLPWLGIDLLARHVRHANGSDYGDGVVYGDGSVYDDGFTGGGTPVFVNSGSTFMTQDVIEKTTQIGIDVSARLPVWKLDLSLTAGYTFEHVVNPDLDSTASPEVNHAFRLGASVTY